jgi:hypothetical protein
MARARRSILMRRRATAQENVASHLILDQHTKLLARLQMRISLEIDGMNTQNVVSDLMRYIERKNNSQA